MARVEFTADFDYRPTHPTRSLVAYKRGYIGTVRRECADQAVAQGKAIEHEPEARQADGEEVSEQDRHRARRPKPGG